MVNKNRLIKTLQKLIQIPSPNPPGNEVAVANYVLKEMKAIKLSTKVISYAKNRPNILATVKGSWPRKKAAKEALCLMPHYDTVPFGDGWKYSPTSGKVVGDKIYGRGTSDDKGNTACCMEALRSLVESGWKPKRDIIFAATADEETGSDLGTIALLAKKAFHCKDALVVDSEGFNTIVSQKGAFHGKVQIFGKKAHAAYNWLGDSAIEKAAKVITALKKHKFQGKKNKYHRAPTINIGTITGGDKVNMVADFCEFSLDHRYLPGVTGKQAVVELKKVIGSVTKDFKLIIDSLQAPYEIDPNHPFVKTFVETSKKMKCPVKFKGSEGATVITFFQKHNIPTFSTGWGAPGTMHSTNEYAKISTLYKGTQLLEQFIKDYDEKR